MKKYLNLDIIMIIMIEEKNIYGEKIIYCMCPKCKSIRKRIDGRFNIIKRGYERNGLARFFCTDCKKWFNEKTGDSLRWKDRISI